MASDTPISATPHHRLAGWNRQSQGETDCRADYFSIGNKPKIRVEVTESRAKQPVIIDNHTIINTQYRLFNWSGLLLPFICCCVLIVAVIWYTRTRRLPFVQRNQTGKMAYNNKASEASYEALPAEHVDETCPKGIQFLLSEQSNSFSYDGRHQSVDNIQMKSIAGYQISMTDKPLSSAGRKVEDLAEEVTVATDVALASFKKAGHQVEAKDLIPSITQLIISSMERTEKKQHENRRYLFEASQNQINREERAALHREDPQWMERIRKACDDLVEEVERSTIRLLLIELCGKTALWLHNVLQVTTSFFGIANAFARVVSLSLSLQPKHCHILVRSTNFVFRFAVPVRFISIH